MSLASLLGLNDPDTKPRVLLIAPHPDDECLVAGGLLHIAVTEGCEVKVVFVTDGDNNPWPQRCIERRWLLGSDARSRLGVRRRAEALNALRVLGVAQHQAEFWSFPDQGLALSLRADGGDLQARMIALLQHYRPAVIIAPSRLDLHPDHNTTGLLVHLALSRSPGPRPECFHYVVHGMGGAVRAADYIALPDRPALRRLKHAALAKHQTQLVLSRRRMMAYADRTEYFIRNDRSAVDDVWLHAADGREAYIAAPRLGSLPGLNVQLLDAANRWSQRRLYPAIRKTGTHTMAKIQGSRLTIPVESKTEYRWLKQDTLWNFRDRSGWLRVMNAPRAVTAQRQVCCVIPCYNVARFCGPVVSEAAGYVDTVIAIDDGSTDGTRDILDDMARHYANVQVLVHPFNRGKGAALLSAFAYALMELDFDVLVTLDADNQHRACDIVPLVNALRASNAALAIGMRDSCATMPLRSRIGNRFMESVVRWIYPLAPEDTQSGFRAHRRGFVAHILERMQGRRYETELQILVHALKQGPVASIAIPTVYQDNNRSSHFKPLRDSLRVLGALGKLWLSDLRSVRRA